MTSPKPDQLDVVIVGAGLAGLYMLLKARRAGLVARVLEAAGGIGGTWYHNRYPGARVDVESLEYSFGFCEVCSRSGSGPSDTHPNPSCCATSTTWRTASAFAMESS